MEIGKQNSALGHEEFFAINGASVHLYDDKRCKILPKSCIVELHCDTWAVDTRQPE